MKYLLASLIILFSLNSGLAQSEQILKKAEEKVQEIDQLLSAVDTNLSLSEEQKKQIRELTIQKLMDIRKVNKSDMSDVEKKSERKKINKAVGKEIHREILSEEQRKAKMTANKSKKEKKK